MKDFCKKVKVSAKHWQFWFRLAILTLVLPLFLIIYLGERADILTMELGRRLPKLPK